jgi:carbon-monoxide dehydrogenase small subunit
MTSVDPSYEVDISFLLNGQQVERRVSARQHLGDFIRDELGLTGTHLGCEHGVCGACSVRVEGRVIRSCLMLAAQVDGCKVETIEGLSDSGELADLQAAFFERNAAQCGFCTAGILLSAREFMSENRAASRQEIREALSGNLCRCTGYHAIVDAVDFVMKRRLEQ